MKIVDAEFGGVHEVFMEPNTDERGFFSRLFCRNSFVAAGLNGDWPQINVSMTLKRGALRGLHFQQKPSEEIKLVTCLTGAVFDVVVDVRPESSTFGHWRAFELSEKRSLALYVPAGFAHGFQCLSDDCRLVYLMSRDFEPALSSGIRYNDEALGVTWPLPVSCISAKDAALSGLDSLR